MDNKKIIEKPVIIVGAGPAGLGMGIILSKMGIEYEILEKNSVGNSFKNWSDSTRLITPSFTGNFFNAPDLNAICPQTSPAYALDKEHLSGVEYATYLKHVSNFYELPIIEGVTIESVSCLDTGEYELKTSNEDIYRTKYLIWGAGEFLYPKLNAFEGSHLCVHYAQIKDYKNLEGTEFVVIGGYESGFDSAIALSKLGKKSLILEAEGEVGDERSDSSFSISPYTKERYDEHKNLISVYTSQTVVKVELKDSKYLVYTESGDCFETLSQPILAVGFDSSVKLIKDLFELDESGHIILNDNDESTIHPGLFLVGPQVKHINVIFCFIYKFRQRFPIVGRKLAQYFGVENSEKVLETIEEYKSMNFYLEDLSCCENECDC